MQPAAAPPHPAPSPFRLFVPDSCTQGGELACHATWRGAPVEAIEVEAPEEIALEQCFNATCERRGGRLLLAGFEVAGYVGLVFRAPVLGEARASRRLRFTVRAGAVQWTQESDVVLFRPHPQVRLVGSTEKTGALRRIVLRNQGFGTSIVKVGFEATPAIRMEGDPFVIGFRANLLAQLPRLRADHPVHAALLDRYGSFLETPLDFLDSARVAAFRQVVTDFVAAIAEDRQFLAGWMGAFDEAGFSNSEDHSNRFALAVEYLQGLTADNLILVGPLDILVIAPGRHTLRLHLVSTDRSGNRYPPLALPSIEVEASEEMRVPLYTIFCVEGAHA
jgi:hypothetical protein